ncbi:hypothetical protein [Actinomadura sp. NPDC049753]|uniref:hypothetical protein n=1 Tax=Actinomadura sp. NPDC049753 TaxID=3154739 RepID=UPI0034363CD9
MTAPLFEVVRAAADGARVSVMLPPEAGPLRWYGATKFSGPNYLRSFHLAEAGQHEVVPSNILPGASKRVYRRNGFDIVVYEAVDHSNGCLVFAGPYNEATTWFGGPPPRAAVLNRIVSMLTFIDSPTGARVTAKPATNIQQHGTMLVGSDARMTVIARDARSARDNVPVWRGRQHGDAEVWRIRQNLREEQAAKLAGTPFEWSYMFANSTAVFDVSFRPEAPPGALTPKSIVDRYENHVDTVLSGLKVIWAA